MEVKEESEKVGLKLNIQKTKIMANDGETKIWSHHLMANRWGNNGNSDKQFFWAPKSLQMVNAAMKLKATCSLEEKMINLDSIFKSRDVALPTKVCLVKAMLFPIVVYGYEIWTIRKAEHRIIDAFEFCC